MKGQIIAGEFGKLIMRQKAGASLEIGELLIAETAGRKILLQVSDLLYGSQISQQHLELISGMQMEEEANLEFYDAHLRNYTLAILKGLITIEGKKVRLNKALPSFFSTVREIAAEDLSFLTKPSAPLFLGKLRSGSKALDVNIFLPGIEVLSHHVLITATTGRGKSNLTSCMLWDVTGNEYCGMLVLDPHDEYYGRNGFGLKDHPSKNVVYYTPKNPPPGTKTLKINLDIITPSHFDGAVEWSQPQKEALHAYYKRYKQEWISKIAVDAELPDVKFNEGTLAVVRRRILQLLDLEVNGTVISTSGVFDRQAGQTTIADICRELEQGKTVIIDTSSFSGAVELLIGGLIATEVFRRYKQHKITGQMKDKPVISIVLEEAPRVLGKDALESGPNIFSTIAREGRKFRIGLLAITQLPSLIPRDILANMNTKIILGIEMKPERQAIIESASQDLSQDDRNIASLDIGEAIVSSNFAKFALPIKIPYFEEFAQQSKEHASVKKGFVGIG